MISHHGPLPYTPQRNASLNAKYATVTILIVTLIYSVFNMPSWLLYTYVLISDFNPITWLRGNTSLYLQIFVCRLSVAMNSAANPIVYFSRIEALSKLTFRKSSLSNSVVSRASNALKLVPRFRKSEQLHSISSRSSTFPKYRVSRSGYRVSLPAPQIPEEVQKRAEMDNNRTTRQSSVVTFK